MVTVQTRPARVLRCVDEAREHVRAICFKTGPPRRVGTELEWTVHHTTDPGRPLELSVLRAALGEHAPTTVDRGSPATPLPHGGAITVEPGGQVEISTPPYESLDELHRSTTADLTYLADRLARRGLRLGGAGVDGYRSPRRILSTPRYDAMAEGFARRGSAGQVMMCGTAATQVCVDAGEQADLRTRWATLHAMGPALLALFATSGRHAGRDTGWASTRMRAWLDMDPLRTWPVEARGDPAAAWARYALAAPLLCLRRDEGPWHPPGEISFADWIAGAITPPPTVDDLEYHLGTLFPPIRPRGYIEVRYLDAQPPEQWFAPVAAVAALTANQITMDAARAVAAPTAGAWRAAARHGLRAPAIREAATKLAELACRALTHTDLSRATADAVADTISRRLAGGGE